MHVSFTIHMLTLILPIFSYRTTISQEEAKPQGIFYFAHDKTILKVHSLLPSSYHEII